MQTKASDWWAGKYKKSRFAGHLGRGMIHRLVVGHAKVTDSMRFTVWSRCAPARYGGVKLCARRTTPMIATRTTTNHLMLRSFILFRLEHRVVAGSRLFGSPALPSTAVVSNLGWRHPLAVCGLGRRATG